MKFNTKVIHAGLGQSDPNGATMVPIYQTSAFEHESAEELEKIFGNKAQGFCYTRVGNPTITAFENRINQLEGGLGTIAAASGMAAITSALLNILRSGDEIISSASLYGGTIDLFKDIEAFGIKTHYVQNNHWEEIEAAFNEHTRAVFAETIGNPGLDVTDLKKLSELAHSHNVPLIVDNTTATNYIIRPIEYGADIVINSSSKYINGSSDAISGTLTDSGKFKWNFDLYPDLLPYKKFGPFCYIAKLRNSLFRDMGACLAPQNAYLNMIGIETLALRMERHCSNALTLAKWFQEYDSSIIVNYPGLPSSPWHEIAKEELNGHFGGIITVRVGSKEKAFKLINGLKIAKRVSNIGDTKTLVIHPASTIALHNNEEQQKAAGVFDDLIRISVGIEDIDDLIEDFKQALEAN